MTLNAPQAYFHGPLRFDHGPGFAHDWLTDWTDADSKVWFDIDVVRAGVYEIHLHYACPQSDAGSEIRVHAGDTEQTAIVPAATAPDIVLPHRDERSRGRYVNRQWGSLSLGRLKLPAGRQRLMIEAASMAGEEVMELKSVTLTRVER